MNMFFPSDWGREGREREGVREEGSVQFSGWRSSQTQSSRFPIVFLPSGLRGGSANTLVGQTLLAFSSTVAHPVLSPTPSTHDPCSRGLLPASDKNVV